MGAPGVPQPVVVSLTPEQAAVVEEVLSVEYSHSDPREVRTVTLREAHEAMQRGMRWGTRTRTRARA